MFKADKQTRIPATALDLALVLLDRPALVLLDRPWRATRSSGSARRQPGQPRAPELPMLQVGGHAILMYERSSRPRHEREDFMNSIHDPFRAHGLVRLRDGRILGGVIAALGRRIGLDPWPARLMFILALLVIPGSQILLYPDPVDPDAAGTSRRTPGDGQPADRWPTLGVSACSASSRPSC
jgi:phage shock protein PspC (stress-responsive transcriptional regulator)